MNEITIRLLAVRDSPHILQAPAHCSTIVTIAGEAEKHAGPLKIVGLFVNGGPRKFRIMDEMTIATSPPIPEGARVGVLCLAPKEAPKASQRQQATHASPDLSYGLQAPNYRNARGSA